MKFTVDTKVKTLTLLEKVSFKELEAIKKFIGEEWKEWNIEAQVITVTNTQYLPSWWYNPLRPYYFGDAYSGSPQYLGNTANGYHQSSLQGDSKGILYCSNNEQTQFLIAGNSDSVNNLTLNQLSETTK